MTYTPYEGPIVSRAEAKAAGLPRYHTGKPCKHGHVCERVTVNGSCRLCSNALSNAVHKANPEKQRANATAWRDANRDRHNASERAANARNRKLNADRVARFHAAHPEARREHYKANAEDIKRRVREWCEREPEKARALSRNYRARAAQAEGQHTGAEVKALLAKQNGKCAYCRKSLVKGYHADHIKPLSRGGSNRINNIQLACASCNCSKGATDPVKFAKRLGLLL